MVKKKPYLDTDWYLLANLNDRNVMKKLVLIVFMQCIFTSFFGQTVFFDPTPTDVTGPVRIYVDISAENLFDGCGNCDPNAFDDVDPETNPLYIWTWIRDGYSRPSDLEIGGETLNVTNGDWVNSNENMLMTQDPDDPDLWYFDYLGASTAQFFGLPAAELYADGVNLLVKEKNGEPDTPDNQQKSADFNLIPEPVGCFDKVCPFPTTFFQDDFFAILYDTKKEANPGLQGGDAYFARFQYKVNGGPYQPLEITDESMVEMDPEGDGVFSLTMIPQEFFGLGENDVLNELRVSFTKPPLDEAPYSTAVSLFPGCP